MVLRGRWEAAIAPDACVPALVGATAWRWLGISTMFDGRLGRGDGHGTEPTDREQWDSSHKLINSIEMV
jgi:hypothetical protein